MASNAVSATIARCHSNRSNPAQVTLQSIATAAGYPGNKASSVRQLARANGHGARANGQGRYATNTHAGWYTVLTGLQVGLQPTATKPQVTKAQGKAMRKALLGSKATAASKQGARKAKRASKAGKPASAPQVAPQPTPQPAPAPTAPTAA